MTAISQPYPETPSHNALLGAYVDLKGDIYALCARFSLSGQQLLTLFDDPAFLARFQAVDALIARDTFTRLQSAAADALNRAMKAATNPLELRRTATVYARLVRDWGQSLLRTRQAARPSRASAPTHAPHTPYAPITSTHPFPAAGAPASTTAPESSPASIPSTPLASPAHRPSIKLPSPPLTLANIPDRPENAAVPQPIAIPLGLNTPNRPEVKISPHLSLLLKAGQAPAPRAGSP